MKVKFNRKIIAIILGLFIITSILIIVGKPIIKNAAEKIEFKISYFNGKIRDLKISKKSLDIEVLVGEKWYKVKTNNYLVKKIEIGDSIFKEKDEDYVRFVKSNDTKIYKLKME